MGRRPRRIRLEGITVVLAPPTYMEEADELCERVAIIIDHGKILVEDTPTALKGSVGAQKIYALDLVGHDRHCTRSSANSSKSKASAAAEPTPAGIRIVADNADGLLPEIVRANHPYGLRDLHA